MMDLIQQKSPSHLVPAFSHDFLPTHHKGQLFFPAGSGNSLQALRQSIVVTIVLRYDFTHLCRRGNFEPPEGALFQTINERCFLANNQPSDLPGRARFRSEEHTSELQSQSNLVCRLLLEKKKK